MGQSYSRFCGTTLIARGISLYKECFEDAASHASEICRGDHTIGSSGVETLCAEAASLANNASTPRDLMYVHALRRAMLGLGMPEMTVAQFGAHRDTSSVGAYSNFPLDAIFQMLNGYAGQCLVFECGLGRCHSLDAICPVSDFLVRHRFLVLCEHGNHYVVADPLPRPNLHASPDASPEPLPLAAPAGPPPRAEYPPSAPCTASLAAAADAIATAAVSGGAEAYVPAGTRSEPLHLPPPTCGVTPAGSSAIGGAGTCGIRGAGSATAHEPVPEPVYPVPTELPPPANGVDPAALCAWRFLAAATAEWTDRVEMRAPGEYGDHLSHALRKAGFPEDASEMAVGVMGAYIDVPPAAHLGVLRAADGLFPALCGHPRVVTLPGPAQPGDFPPYVMVPHPCEATRMFVGLGCIREVEGGFVVDRDVVDRVIAALRRG